MSENERNNGDEVNGEVKRSGRYAAEEHDLSFPTEGEEARGRYAAKPESVVEPEPDGGGGPSWNVLSIVSLVTGFFLSIVGVVLGFVALHQIGKSGERGKGLAVAGIIVGGVQMVVTGLLVVLFIIIPAFLIASDPAIVERLESESSGGNITEVLPDSGSTDSKVELAGCDDFLEYVAKLQMVTDEESAKGLVGEVGTYFDAKYDGTEVGSLVVGWVDAIGSGDMVKVESTSVALEEYCSAQFELQG